MGLGYPFWGLLELEQWGISTWTYELCLVGIWFVHCILIWILCALGICGDLIYKSYWKLLNQLCSYWIHIPDVSNGKSAFLLLEPLGALSAHRSWLRPSPFTIQLDVSSKHQAIRAAIPSPSHVAPTLHPPQWISNQADILRTPARKGHEATLRNVLHY